MSENYQACPRCTALTEPGDHFPVADGTAYHVLCYQAAMLEAGQPNPFPLCDHCGQLIWELDGPGELVIRHLTLKQGDWVPARWHRQCAPAEAGPELPDRDDPPPQPKPRLDPEALDKMNKGMAQAAQQTVEEIVASVPTLGVTCAKCSKPVQRSLTMVDGQPYHKLCGSRIAKGLARAEKAAAKAATKGRPTCVQCSKKITHKTFADNTEEPIECETDAGILNYHRKCYQAACIAAGQPDPFPKVEKELLIPCGYPKCGQAIPRSAFRQHVADHEAGDWDGTKAAQ